ncbi:hypothetical protein SAMN05421820_102574 [Pedobacter steynii]|uniref:Outer membrane protein beta-barrel domain-containing protein n=1 Tax=Pedobacter steynii TaxID=430522 RepID=A0A1G9P837_9SPHI|nr:hypothetical protein [Pedobacter steynii]NQX39063.1 hypothetical protein [Pedobacter steynii]SDL94910.1 hypothetical protein SAMN05421820_102574 [Pedobacter steynii]
MKNSEWYNKLWQRKLKELPLQKDTDEAWADMKHILDQQMPENGTKDIIQTNTDNKLPVSGIIALFRFILPLAAMIGIVIYSNSNHSDKKSPKKKDLKQIVEKSLSNHTKKEMHKNIIATVDSGKNGKLTIGKLNNSNNVDFPIASDTIINSQNILTPDKITEQIKLVEIGYDSILSSPFNSKLNLGKITTSKIPSNYRRQFNYGIKTGYKINNNGDNAYFGAYAFLDINKRWYVSPELIINTSRLISASFSSANYLKIDSIAPFKIIHSKKVYIFEVPLNIGYRVSKNISLSAGPVFSILIKQKVVPGRTGYVTEPAIDTISKTKIINAALAHSPLTPKFNLGISAGISMQAGKFIIETKYQQNLIPSKVSSDLGEYKFNNSSLILGVAFGLNNRP